MRIADDDGFVELALTSPARRSLLLSNHDEQSHTNPGMRIT